MTHAADSASRLDALARWYEALAPTDLARLDEFYAANASFSDPFNEVAGRHAIRGVLAHMFSTLEAPRFAVTARAAAAGTGFLSWTFTFRLRGKAYEIRGATQFEFDGRGKIVRHVDHWDAGRQVYEKIPLLGALARLMRRRLAAG